MRRSIVGAFAALALTQSPALSQEDAGGVERFPGGATAITETHEDWTVICLSGTDGRRCLASQTLGTSESRQPILSMEVAARPQAEANALLTLPFGLDLREGVRLRLDDDVLAATVPFSACTEQGCLVSIDLGPEELDLFRNGTALRVSARPADDDDPVVFTISLRGLSSAFDRTIDLLR